MRAAVLAAVGAFKPPRRLRSGVYNTPDDPLCWNVLSLSLSSYVTSYFLFRNLPILLCKRATWFSIASTCHQPIADNCPYKPILNLDFQLPKPSASSDATVLGCAARFNLSPVDTPGLMHDRRFQGFPAVGQSLLSGCTADSLEVSDSDDDLPSVRKIIARSKSTIDLTLDDDDDSNSDKNTNKVS